MTGFQIVWSLLAVFGGYIALTHLTHWTRIAALWLAFQVAGEEHPECLDRLANAMENQPRRRA